MVRGQGEEFVARLAPTQSQDNCIVLTKDIYFQIVSALVDKMNKRTCPAHFGGRSDQAGASVAANEK
eukprot:7242504-Ditylum_brightwellii.AAC.1